MTQNTYTRIQRQNAITERDQHAQDVADSREFLTPFTVSPGVALVDVTVMPAFEPDEVKIALTFLTSQEIRCMPNRRATRDLVIAYAAYSTNGIQICGRVNWPS